MANQNPSIDALRQQLEALRASLSDAELDADSYAELKALDEELHALLHEQHEQGEHEEGAHVPLLERVREVEEDLVNRNPTAARFVGNLVDMLSRMGV